MALKFFWDCENSLTLTGTDYSSGDNVGSNTSTSFATGAAKTGTYGVSSPASTLANIAFTATDIWPSAADPSLSAGCIGFWAKWPTGVPNNQTIFGFRCYGSTTSDRICVEGLSGDGVQIAVNNVTNGAYRCAGATGSFPTNVWRFVVARWDYVSNKLAIEVYSDAGGGTLSLINATEQTGLALSTTYLPTTDFATLQIAYHSSADTEAGYFDHFLISDAYAAPLQNNAFITDYTTYSETTLALISVANDTPIYDGMLVQLGGSGFGSAQGASTVKVQTADGSPSVTQTITTWSDEEITFTLESSALPFGSVTVEAVVGGATATIGSTLVSASGYANSVANVPWPGGAVSVFTGASPAVVDGDLYEYEIVSDLGASVDLLADGTFIINSATGTHKFDVRVYDQTDETWSAFVEASVSAAESVTGGNGGVRTVYTLSSVSGLRKWVDYIPVKVVTPTATDLDTFNDAGGLVTVAVTNITGKVAWVDYMPVYIVTDPTAGRWRYDDLGWVPVTDA